MQGPGRFVIFSTGTGPWMSGYPDSDKVSGPAASSCAAARSATGTARERQVLRIERERGGSPPQPVVNALTLATGAQLGPLLGTEQLDATLMHLAPGEGSAPYHYVYGRERWMLVLTGTASLRHPQGDGQLTAGAVVCLPEGPAGAYRLLIAQSELFGFLLHFDARSALNDTGPYELADGRVVIVRDHFLTAPNYHWAHVSEGLPHCVTQAMFFGPAENLKLTVNDLGTTFSDPKDYHRYLTGVAVYARDTIDTPASELHPLTSDAYYTFARGAAVELLPPVFTECAAFPAVGPRATW